MKNLLIVASSIAIAVASPAFAQNEATSDEDATEIIVTATAGGAAVRKQDAAFALTTVDDKAIDQFAPQTTADLLKLIPGVSVESSGGQNGANIFVRGFPGGGDAEFVTFQYEGSPSFPPPTLSFLENSQLFRLDETVQRVEAVRGGPAQVFSNGQAGLTVNVITKKGGDEFAGLVKASITDYSEKRIDAVVSGPLGSKTSFMLGGFYHSGNGVRDAQYTSERGGQISANIEHDFGKGKILVYARLLDDHGSWLLPIPVVQNGSKISSFPGFSAGTGTFYSRETRLTRLNDGTIANQSDGRGAKLVNFGTNINYDVADKVSLFSKLGYLKGSADTTGLVPAGPPTTLQAIAAGFGSTIGTATFVNGGGAASQSDPVILVGAWRVNKDIEAFTNETGLTFDFGSNKLTAGIYYASFSSRDKWNLGNSLLLQARSNPRILNLTLADGRQVTRNGFARGAFFNVNADYNGEDIAGYISDEFQATDKLRFDAGIRWQQHKVNGALENNSFGVDTDNNPNTLFNNSEAVLNGTFSNITFKKDAIAYTAGANYAFTNDVGVFVRISRGNSFPQFDQLRDGLRLTQKIDTYEGGLKVSKDLFDLYATAFYNEFKGITNTQILNGAPVPNVGSAEAKGFELEGTLRPFKGLSVGGNLTYLDANYTDFFVAGGTVDASGNQLERQPKFQVRGRAAYTAELGFGEFTIYGAALRVGKRFSDNLNQQVLPAYTKADAGAILEVNDRLQLQVSADNLFNSRGLTEGNPRVLGSQGSGTILARPINGRSFTFSAQFKF
jgi:iron complex outermembrane recepter protein